MTAKKTPKNPVDDIIGNGALKPSTPSRKTKAERNNPRKDIKTQLVKTENGFELEIPVGYTLKKESRTKRLQLLVTPSMMDGLKAIADKEGKSINQVANDALEEYVRKEV